MYRNSRCGSRRTTNHWLWDRSTISKSAMRASLSLDSLMTPHPGPDSPGPVDVPPVIPIRSQPQHLVPLRRRELRPRTLGLHPDGIVVAALDAALVVECEDPLRRGKVHRVLGSLVRGGDLR